MTRDYLTSAIAVSLARAAYWTAYAHTPANMARTVVNPYRIKSGPFESPMWLSKDALIDDAMNTANTHLTRAQELLDQLNVTP